MNYSQARMVFGRNRTGAVTGVGHYFQVCVCGQQRDNNSLRDT